MYRRWQVSKPFFPIEGDQRNGSPLCRAPWRKELSGTGRFPLSEQVRRCSCSNVDHSSCSEGCWCSSLSVCSHHSNCLEKRTAEGNTALHYSVLHHKPESLKLLLKSKAALHTGAIFKHFKELFFCSVHFINNPIFFYLYYSELCRRNSPGYCTEASALPVCRLGEAPIICTLLV